MAPQFPITPGPPAPKAKKRKWPWIVGGILLLFVVIGVANGGSGQTTQNRPGVPSGVTSDYTAQPAAEAPAQRQQQSPSGPQTTFGPGTHEVGADIEPGKYKTQGGGLGGSCYWARLKNTDGDFDSIITNGNAQGPTTITISKSDGAFETTCDTWTKAG